MFAPPIAKTKSSELQHTIMAPQRPTQTAVSLPLTSRRTIGNQAMIRRLALRAGEIKNEPDTLENAARLRGSIQTKLKIGAVNDPLEHEADRVADQVMSMPAPEVSISATPPEISRKCAECEGEEE